MKENDASRLKALEWMFTPKGTASADFEPEYGNLSDLNKDGLIKRSIRKDQLQDIVSEYLDLLETSATIFEKNGDYAMGIFSSGWCRMMDAASRRLSNTADNREALESGEWLCRDSCWKDASQRTMAEGKPVVAACNGGIKLYAVPVWAHNQLVGAITFGFDSPPKDDTELKKLSEKYKIPLAELRKQSDDYTDRPQFVIDYAKRRIEKSAQHLGYLVERSIEKERISEIKEQHRTTFHSIGDAVITTDKNGRITNMNPVAEMLCGWKFEEAEGKPLPEVFRIVNAKTRKTVIDPVDIVLKSKKVVGLANHTVLISKNGQEYQIADSAAPIINKDGKITGVVMVFSDVTEKYESERLLEQAKERYRIISETISDFSFSCIKGEKGYEIDWLAGAVEKITGYTVDEITAQKCWRFMVHPDDDPVFVKHVLSLKPGEESKCELRIFDQAGNLKWLHVNTICLVDADKGIHKIYGGCEDITEHRKAEEVLLRTQQTVDKSPLGIFWISPEGKFLYVNETAAKKLQYTREELLSMHVWDVDPNYPKDIREEQFKLHREHGGRIIESEHRRADGTVFPVKINAYILTFEGQEMEIAEVEDITERKRAEVLVKESEEKHRRLFETMSQGVIYQSADGSIVSANPAAEKMLGLSLDQMRGKTSMDPRWKMIMEDGSSVSGEDHPVMMALRTGEIVGPAIRGVYIPEKDQYVWLSIIATPLFRPGEDKPFQSYAVFDDITEKKHKEDQVREQQQLIETIFEKLPIGIAVNTVKPTVKFETINNRFAEIYGVSREDLKNPDSFWDLVYEDERFREEIKNRVLSDMEGGDPARMLWQDIPLTKNGKVVKYITAQNIPLKDRDGDFVISTVMDVTERKLAEEALRESEERFRVAQDFSPDGFTILQPLRNENNEVVDFIWVYQNKATGRINNTSPEEVVGKRLLELFPSHKGTAVFQTYVQVANSGEPKILEEVFVGKIVSTPTWLRIVVVPMGKDIAIIIQNITDRMQAEKAMQIAKERAEESDRLKSAFLANMSHEIRTPMNGIMGFTELLRNSPLTGQQQKYVEIIEKSGTRLLGIINDIVDISRIEAGIMDVTLEESDINEQLEYTFSFFKPQVDAKGMELVLVDMLPTKKAKVITDREKVYAILTNLVKNAIKYSNDGQIRFGCLIKDSCLEFYVKDEGIGIPAGRQQAIFDRFVQGDIEDKDARQGAGLGLAIAKAYVDMLGGNIRVESEEGKGSTFYFTIPLQKEPGETENHKPDDPGKAVQDQDLSLKILIVEDDEYSAILIKEHLQKNAREILHAANGLEAVAICRNQPNVDLILMDVKMPGMDGAEATRQIRRFNKDVVIIAQTAMALVGDKQNMLDAGCNDYITKPIDKDQLQALIQQYFGG